MAEKTPEQMMKVVRDIRREENLPGMVDEMPVMEEVVEDDGFGELPEPKKWLPPKADRPRSGVTRALEEDEQSSPIDFVTNIPSTKLRAQLEMQHSRSLGTLRGLIDVLARDFHLGLYGMRPGSDLTEQEAINAITKWQLYEEELSDLLAGIVV